VEVGTHTEPASSRRPGLSFEALAIGLLFVGVAFRALLIPAQNDTFWHLRAGADIWRTGQVPLVDSYSFTAAALPYHDHEWLWQALLYGCHRAGGWPLCNLMAAAVVVGSVALAYRMTSGSRLTRFVLLVIVLAPASCAWALRPQIVTLLALVWLVRLLERERFWAIPFVFLAWANLHAGVLAGGLVLVAALAAATLRWLRQRGVQDRRRLAWLALVVPLAGLATCATPLGLGLFRYIWGFKAHDEIAWISEWETTLPNGWLGGAFWIVALAFVLICFRRWRALRDGPAAAWRDWVVVAAAWALLPLAFRSLRNISPFLMLAAPAASRLLGASFRFHLPGRRPSAAPTADHPLFNLSLLAGAGVLATAIVVLASTLAPGALDWHPIGDGALRAVQTCQGPLYNRYDEGGYLIWFAPEKKVFIDSRHDPFPPAFMHEAIDVQYGRRPYQPLFARWGIRCAFLPVDGEMAATLREAGWIFLARDRQWAVLTAPSAAR
jgi:hypothetical protein